MGIRIHKSLGWGNSKSGAHWKTKSPDFEPIYENSSLQDFKKWCLSNEKDIVGFHNELLKYSHQSWNKEETIGFNYLWEKKKNNPYAQDWDIYKFIQHSPNEDRIKEILLVPVTQKSWIRFDETMDYIEETTLSNGSCDRFTYIKNSQGIYPWVGMIPDIEIPKDYRVGIHYNPATPSDYSQLVGWWDEGAKPKAQGPELELLLNNWRPMIPIEVTCLVWRLREYLKDPLAFAKSLRPAIYVYWG